MASLPVRQSPPVTRSSLTRKGPTTINNTLAAIDEFYTRG
jgi:hypothetical protein